MITKVLNRFKSTPKAGGPKLVNVVRQLPNGHIAFGLDENAPTIDPGEVCFCGHCQRCRFADAMINGLLERFPKFREWTRDQPPIFWLNYRAHYQAIADGVLAILETYTLGENKNHEIRNRRAELPVQARRKRQARHKQR